MGNPSVNVSIAPQLSLNVDCHRILESKKKDCYLLKKKYAHYTILSY